MATGDSNDILYRVKRVIPARWFAWTAPISDAVIGGLSDLAAWCYNWIGYARMQSRIATATGLWLDIIAYDYLGRAILRNGLSDDAFRAYIVATVLKERVTRAGMVNAITTLTGNAPWIFEPWNTGDTSAYSNFALGISNGQMGYGVGRGGYGSLQLPGQLFMKAVRGASSGVANATGYGYGGGGYTGTDVVSGQSSKGGNIEFVGSFSRLEGITDGFIQNLITYTKPSGVTVWLQIS